MNPYVRRCSTCGDQKPLGRFCGAAQVCRECKARSDRRRRSRAKWRRAERDRRLRRAYGITLEDFLALCRAQRWRCAVCGRRPYPEGSRLVVDHNHVTGEIRGALCRTCNSALGLMGEKPERLRAAADYLDRRGNYRDRHG